MANDQAENKEKGKESEDMGFLGHLGELRSRIIWSLVGVIIGAIISGVYINEIMEIILLGPAKDVKLGLQNLRPFGQPFLYFKVVFVVGFILAFPFILYQLWKFVKPGLYPSEKKWVSSITFFTSLCFLSGVAFAYFVMIPSMLNFAAQFGTDQIINMIDVNEYFSFITMMLLAAGLLFEMPMVTYVLSRIGMLTPSFMQKYRRHAIILILILAAVITPTPDPVTQLIFASPLFILYELSIIIARFGMKKHDTSGEETAN
jgi:sec-independent protein translocase protein TatC